jgi:hypothetical protein
MRRSRNDVRRFEGDARDQNEAGHPCPCWIPGQQDPSLRRPHTQISRTYRRAAQPHSFAAGGFSFRPVAKESRRAIRRWRPATCVGAAEVDRGPPAAVGETGRSFAQSLRPQPGVTRVCADAEGRLHNPLPLEDIPHANHTTATLAFPSPAVRSTWCVRRSPKTKGPPALPRASFHRYRCPQLVDVHVHCATRLVNARSIRAPTPHRWGRG